MTIISPVELVRTRVQGGTKGLRLVLKDLAVIVEQKGMKSLWRGLTASLWRDVPFSALYWFSFESFKTRITKAFPRRTYSQELWSSFLAGSTSGIVYCHLT